MRDRRRRHERGQTYARSRQDRRGLAPPLRYPDEAYDDWEADDWDDERRRRVGLISPARVLLFLVVLIAGGVALYGFLDRTALQLPIIIVGLGLLGVTLLILSLSLARAAAMLARQGSGGKALLAALLGGFCILGAAGSLTGAIVLAMLTV